MTKPEQEWTKILGWPGYRVYKYEINETKKKLKLWVRQKSGNQKSDTPRRAGGLMSWAASKAVGSVV